MRFHTPTFRCRQFLIIVGILLLYCTYLTVPSFNNYPIVSSGSSQLPWKQCPSTQNPKPRAQETSHKPRLAVIIPFRDRFTELQILLVHLSKFLERQKIEHTFYVVNQVDSYRFNRGALLNAGATESLSAEYNGVQLEPFSSLSLCPPRTAYLALHDVDLLPWDPAIDYSIPSIKGPRHLIPAHVHPRYYWYRNYFGGVVLIRRVHFSHVNGMSNSFWGWGEEDDEFRFRILRTGLTISHPSNLTFGKRSFLMIHNEFRHKRDANSYYSPEVRNLLSKQYGGLSTANYTVVSRHLLELNRIPALVINVQLKCNMDPTLCRGGLPEKATLDVPP